MRLHRHGVDFSIQNVTNANFSFWPGRADDYRPGSQSELVGPGDNSVPPGVKEMRWLAPPGLIPVACKPRGGSQQGDETPSREAVLRVVDPEGLYVPVPRGLDCQGGSDHSYEFSVFIRSDDPEEPVRATREELVGLRPGDTVARTGYPGDRSPWIKLIRARRVVALVNVGLGIGSNALLWTCVESGIRRRETPSSPPRPRNPSPIPTERFPPQSSLVEGMRYWVLYLSIDEKGSLELEEAIDRARPYGYAPHVRTLGCDEGAAEAYRLPREFLGVAVYFDRERDPWFVGDAINAPHWEPIRITAHCVD